MSKRGPRASPFHFFHLDILQPVVAAKPFVHTDPKANAEIDSSPAVTGK
ncbi:hypothetical protein QU481_13910 [Crenobacter sp. SG2303]|uniref:Uncharacterized protein n=1 Tax=Crenobacter oryzisoli TaxID=3056844 RepID=A0ABT7XQB9_9NEIS|nr:hypothetical protein [Crenobacter sp. SG2303]MDN0075982.1 hypothetical protein [Crenobacter sp. SG2303]